MTAITVPSNYATIDYAKWMQANQAEINDELFNTSGIYETDESGYVSESGEKCTDGKDDGKIGLFGAIGNFVKGAGKAVVNGVKGMFTDKEGKFSLGKTLLSIGTVAACIAFPAVGVALGTVGAVAGGVQIAKGAYRAATAKTDAEAKEAWQDMGGGTLQVGLSVAAAKGSLNAMKATSSAGAGGGSALSELEKGASLTEKAGALGKDAFSSTKNNALRITDTAKSIRLKNSETRLSKAEAKYSEARAKFEEADITNDAEFDLAQKELETAAKNYKKAEAKNAKAQSSYDKVTKKGRQADSSLEEFYETKRNNIKGRKETKAELKEKVADAKEALKEAKKTKNKTTIEEAKGKLADAKAQRKEASLFGKTKSKLKETDTAEALAKFKNGVKDSKGIKAKASHIWKNIKTGSNYTDVAKALGTDGLAILDALRKGANYSELVDRFGYENVTPILETIASVDIADSTI